MEVGEEVDLGEDEEERDTMKRRTCVGGRGLTWEE